MANLLNLDVDTLFEQHSVPEIDIVQKKIQAVVEEKREELRTMVGERYRDLLKAADTIAAMQESSGTLIAQVEAIHTNCRNLNEQQLIGFKTGGDCSDLVRNRNANKQLNNYFSVMVQIKLLTALPELIWSEIDREHYYTAAELFIFSRHISTGLQLDAHNPLMHRLPVAKKQWEILKPFHVTIKQCVLRVLQREVLSAEVAVDCLLSLLLLEKSHINDVLKSFLQLRCAAFSNCLSDEACDEVALRRVKERILASLQVLNGTIDLMSKCFMGENGLLALKLEEHSDPSAPPTVALMDSNDAQFAYLLPEIIANFRPKIATQALDGEQVRAALDQWLVDTQRIAGVQLRKLFELVAAMSTIQEIKTAAHDCRQYVDFSPIVAQCGLAQPLDFYELQYVPLINQRVRDIIHSSWAQTTTQTFASLQQVLQQKTGAHAPPMWQESANELPLSLAQALSDDRKVKRLLAKTKGYDADVLALCTDFNRRLAAIVSEMSVLLAEQTMRTSDKLALIEFLRTTAEEQLTAFLDQLSDLSLGAEQRQQLLFVVRMCAALVELCPHLRICFCQCSDWRQYIGHAIAGSAESWQRICQRVERAAFDFWQQIVDGILAELACERRMPSALTYDIILEDFASWETVTLDQKDEQDNTVHSTYRIPSQPRISLQLHLAAIINTLNTVVPQTLPPLVLQAFNRKLLGQLLAHYDQLKVAAQSTPSQHVALQLYFDLRFLQSVFGVGRDERPLSAHFSALLDTLKELIDPFDFELFVEQIAQNVKRAAARLHCQLGVLTPHIASVTASASASLAHEKEPNVLGLSSCGSTSLWFPLLPIVTQSDAGAVADAHRMASYEAAKTTPTRKLNAASTTQTAASAASLPASSRKSDTTTTTSGTATTKAKSGAASFFGAMSQEWFR